MKIALNCIDFDIKKKVGIKEKKSNFPRSQLWPKDY